MSEDCIFCKIVAGELPSKQFHQDELVTAFQDISEQAPVHILIVPNQHFNDLGEMGDDQAEILGRIAQVAGQLADSEGIASEGWRLSHQYRQTRRPGSLPYPLSPAWRTSSRPPSGALKSSRPFQRHAEARRVHALPLSFPLFESRQRVGSISR